jgi:hypothetical protein
MSELEKFLTRQEIHKQYGWSMNYIDRHLPRVKIGGKVLISADALQRLLRGDKETSRAVA